MKDIISANIQNLTSLWTKAGYSQQTQIYENHLSIGYANTPNAEWPNRLWFKTKPEEQTLCEAKKIIETSASNPSLSYWNTYGEDNHEMIESNGFIRKSSQVGMSLMLNRKFDHPHRLDFQRVDDEKTAKIWADLYPKSFNYCISEAILIKTYRHIAYYLFSSANKAVGTAILFLTEDIAGIHGVGVIPEMRKRGFAEEIMYFLLNKAIDLKARYATLQASEMGRGIYQRMGFSEDFTMTNYGLTRTAL
ncbi:GNAT family N-acetyltransferase [Olivibacter sp. SDN3]|uniref:GNAT family N-acetyltransferase n=1 Tax=Olivibacter sp. SDN3 TaxID=2764720 RepID=UPI0016510220|nr:GNAT family N-acetyltransferase [Olivibacter sp. SDN3]QNL48002.1 GNAT family N-acetyltransferase [Olivibacter sp. SDN3]